jgi:hypothetical protein
MIPCLLHNHAPSARERFDDVLVAENAQVLIGDIEHCVCVTARMQQDPLARSLYPLRLSAHPVLHALAVHQQQRRRVSRELAKGLALESRCRTK